MADIYPFEPKRMVLPPEHDAHVGAYDKHVFMLYRIKAKKLKDEYMTFALKQAINAFYFPFRYIRTRLLFYYPDYLERDESG